MTTCQIPECDQKAHGRGMCRSHYMRQWRYGDPHGAAQRAMPEELFWSHVDKTSDPNGCWIWTGARIREYGCMNYRGRSRPAHRVAYELQFGPIPDGLFVMHECDVRMCVRHLRLGTAADNSRDMVEKGRSARGDRHWTARNPDHSAMSRRLTADAVRAIRAAYDGRKGQVIALAREYGVSDVTIRKIVTGRTWRHVH